VSGLGGHPAPDRARRFELYQKFRKPQLRSIDRRLATTGAVIALVVVGGLVASTAMIDEPGLAAAIGLGIGLAATVTAYQRWVSRWQYDRTMQGEFAFPELPRSDAIALSWVEPSDVDDLARALDPGLTASLHWREADRTEFLDLAMLPGFAAEGLRWTLRDPRTGNLLGFAAAGVDEADPTVLAVNLRLLPAAQGRGLGRDALALVLPAQHALLLAVGGPAWQPADEVSVFAAEGDQAMAHAVAHLGGVARGTIDHTEPDGSTTTMTRYRVPSPSTDQGAPVLEPPRSLVPKPTTKDIPARALVWYGAASVVLGIIALAAFNT
jgi:hypothetical protein